MPGRIRARFTARRQLLSALLLMAQGVFAQGYVRHLAGQVSRGEEFRREMAPGIFFVLRPTDSGWMIRVVPKEPCGNNADWASVVNAPYRNYNALYVDASYGITAEEAVRKMSSREFRFAVTCEDYQLESDRLQIALWPYTHSKKEVDEAMAKLGTSPLGKGRFVISDSRTSPAEQDVDGKDYGRVDWIRFELDITLPKRNGGKP
jgi:hypothetical protein